MYQSQKLWYIPYAFLLPAIILIVIGNLWPVLYGAHLSLFDWELGFSLEKAEFTGLENFYRAIQDKNLLSSIGITLLFTFSVVSIEMILGIGLALFVQQHFKRVSFIQTILILPIMIAPIVVGLVWRYIFDTNFGAVNYFVTSLGFSPLSLLADPTQAFIGVIIADIWQWTPFVFLMIYSGMKGLNYEIIDAAKIDGAKWWQILLYVKIPMLMPVIIFTLLLRLIDAFRVLEVIFIMTFGGPSSATEILSMHIYKTAFIANQMGYASAISFILLLITFSLAFIMLLFHNPLKSNK